MDERMLDILMKIDNVLSDCHATTQETLVVGVQVIKAAFSQIAEDNPKADMTSLADSITETLNNSIKGMAIHRQPMAEA